jgi:hypothetical protein
MFISAAGPILLQEEDEKKKKKKKNAKLLIERKSRERNRLLPVSKKTLLYKHSKVGVDLTNNLWSSSDI